VSLDGRRTTSIDYDSNIETEYYANVLKLFLVNGHFSAIRSKAVAGQTLVLVLLQAVTASVPSLEGTDCMTIRSALDRSVFRSGVFCVCQEELDSASFGERHRTKPRSNRQNRAPYDFAVQPGTPSGPAFTPFLSSQPNIVSTSHTCRSKPPFPCRLHAYLVLTGGLGDSN
jgi:hypothetical protein